MDTCLCLHAPLRRCAGNDTGSPGTPGVPHVTINLYQEGFAADGVTPTLKLVDTTQTSSWDDWAQGFYPNSSAGSGTGAWTKALHELPRPGARAQHGNPGALSDLFYFTLYDQPEYLDLYNSQHNGGTLHTLPYNSQFKCYDAMHVWNQIEPAPYDGMYSFPSVAGHQTRLPENRSRPRVTSTQSPAPPQR